MHKEQKMNKKNLEILGLADGANADDINAAYERLKEKYSEERFKDGEIGNNAARMLTRIETARDELLEELGEAVDDGGDKFGAVEKYLREANLMEAQRVLDGFNERGAEWHYLQSVVFYRKNWINESKKQLEIAIQLDGDNAKYREAYRKLNEKIQFDANQQQQQQQVYEGQTMNSQPADSQMGGNFCANCIECCYLNMCLNCLCNGCCR